MPKLRARYKVVPLGMQDVTYTACTMNKETKSLEQKSVTEKKECFMVLFPQGHSIRVTSREQLVELGYDKKPRIVDMETGDVIERGGDEYDFDNMEDNLDVIIEEDKAPSRKKEPA